MGGFLPKPGSGSDSDRRAHLFAALCYSIIGVVLLGLLIWFYWSFQDAQSRPALPYESKTIKVPLGKLLCLGVASIYAFGNALVRLIKAALKTP